jgi:hypothetical protein
LIDAQSDNQKEGTHLMSERLVPHRCICTSIGAAMRSLAALVATVVTSAALAGPCGPGNGDCCSANGTPGCDDVACCQAICAADPFCCNTAWDGICANAAVAQCKVCSGGGGACPGQGGDCCSANGTPGCDDVACCELICAADPFCCDTAWDSICASAAQTQCKVCSGGGNPACGPGAGDCFVANGTPGCDDVACCETVCAVDPFCCDVAWDSICASEALKLCATR